MFTHPAVGASAITLDVHVFDGEVSVVWRSHLIVGEVVAAHDAGEPVVVGQGEGHCSGVLGAILGGGGQLF